MKQTHRRRTISAPPRGLPARAPTGLAQGQNLIVDGYAPTQMIEDLRKYQTELEIQNQALRYSQQEAEGASERFATLFSNVPLALMVVDEEGLVLASNAQALRLFQPKEGDQPLHFLLPFVGAGHTDAVATAFIRAKSHGTSEASELAFNAGSRGLFTGDLHIARIENPLDELAHFICAIIDQGPLLAQRRALQESAVVLRQRNDDLLLSENRMAAVINSSLDAIVCIDDAYRITVFNPAATLLFDCPAELAIGSPLERFLPALAQTLRKDTTTTPAMRGEFRAQTLEGSEIFVEISVSSEHDAREAGVHGSLTTIFARDLTARNLAEAQRLTLETQLRESQKMQAVGTMAGGIAHDFNNILTAILGNVALATQDVAHASPAHTSLLEIEKAGQRARDLVRQILTFSRNEHSHRIPLYLAEVVYETARLAKVTLPPSVELQTSILDNSMAVLADATQVEQALLNLCTNAILAVAPGKGTVHIELGGRILDSASSERIGVPAGAYVTLRVSDNGKGIDAQVRSRIFEPFFTTREVGHGTGLGLSVVHGIMQTHMGAVDVHSTPGLGSVFTLYFPATTQPVPEAGAMPDCVPTPPRASGARVMYVDDDPALVYLMQRTLGRLGFAVHTYEDPHAALAALERDPTLVDLVVTDYNMPGYSGLDLLRDIQRLRPGLAVALASGYITPELEQTALAQGAAALIYKPNDIQELCETIERLTVQPPRP